MKDLNNFDLLRSSISLYLYPELLKLDNKDKIDVSNIDKNKLQKYNIQLLSIGHVYNKIKRYDIFFSEFYPNNEDKISNAEALDHHIHAYLEDLDRLRDKIIHFLQTLKKDLKIIAINKNEAGKSFDKAVKDVLKIFKQVSKYRVPHHHRGVQFLDSDLVDSSGMRTMIDNQEHIKQFLKPGALDIIKQKEIESFKKAKANWVSLANKNKVQVFGFINELFGNISPLIFDYLNISSVKDLFGDVNKVKK
ncbi:MAG: hypothetical protein V1865_00870 [bacterium]